MSPAARPEQLKAWPTNPALALREVLKMLNDRPDHKSGFEFKCEEEGLQVWEEFCAQNNLQFPGFVFTPFDTTPLYEVISEVAACGEAVAYFSSGQIKIFTNITNLKRMIT